MKNKKQNLFAVLFLFLIASLLLISCGQKIEADKVDSDSNLRIWSIKADSVKNEWISFKINRIEGGKVLTARSMANISRDLVKDYNANKPYDFFFPVESYEKMLTLGVGAYQIGSGDSRLLYLVYNPEDSIHYFPLDKSIKEEGAKIADAKSRANSAEYSVEITSRSVLALSLYQVWKTTGLYGFISGTHDLNVWATDAFQGWSEAAAARSHHAYEVNKTSIPGYGNLIMIVVGLILLFLAIRKGYEPLLLVPIGTGCILANIPFVGIAGPEGFIGMLYQTGVETGLFPLLIFMGVGAMTDFGPLLANPKTLLLGGAAQFGIFFALMGAVIIGEMIQIDGKPFFSLYDAGSIGIIGGADGPTAIFVSRKLSPDLLGAIAVAAYSYMALVPVIQPPFMKLLTTKKERQIKMEQLRVVTQREKIIFPLVTLTICILLLPDATPLLGALLFGNLCKESGVTARLSDTMQNALINIVTICLGLSVGSKMSAEKFLVPQTLGILVLGVCAFIVGTSMGVIFAKIMNKFSKSPINPLIGSAGVSAVPMAARVSNKVGQEANPQNFLLMHAMGPNVAGVIGSAVAAGIMLNLIPFLAG